jgi:hypothetical protein
MSSGGFEWCDVCRGDSGAFIGLESGEHRVGDPSSKEPHRCGLVVTGGYALGKVCLPRTNPACLGNGDDV